MPRSLTASLISPGLIEASERQSMLDLMRCYYRGIDAVRFEADLESKKIVVLLKTPDDRIAGFSTVDFWETEGPSGPIQVLFSGDTIIEKSYWGSPLFAIEWIRAAARVKSLQPQLPLYWFLIVKGHRTYRKLAVFAERYFPSCHWSTPENVQTLMHQLAQTRFREAYDRSKGIIRHLQNSQHLIPALADIPEKDAGRAEVAYFKSRNPGYRYGDELVCLTEICPQNLKPFASRIFQAELQK